MNIRHRAFRAGVFLTAVAGALAGAFVSAAPAAAEEQYQHYKNGFSGKCLDVLDFSQANGSAVGQWDCWNGPTQLWLKMESKRYPGFYQYKNKNSGKCLEVPNFDTADRAKIVQFDCWDGPNQAWQTLTLPTNNTDPRFDFRADILVNKNSDKCLEIADFSKENGDHLQQFTCWRDWARSFQSWSPAIVFTPR